MKITGILLAAGSGSRFGGGKLLHPLADGRPIGVASLGVLRSALENVVVVVRKGDDAARTMFEEVAATVIVSEHASLGMGHSLAAAIAAAKEADGWIIALADMPYLRPATVTTIAQRIAATGLIALPSCQGSRGHPVGFGRRYLDELLGLQGDAGARAVVGRHAGDVEVVETDDPGTLRDIDTPADLRAG